MGRRRAEEPERPRGVPDGVGSSEDREFVPVVARVLALQRSAGNAAVARLISPARPVLAREGDAAAAGGVADVSGEGGSDPADQHAHADPQEALAVAVQARAAATGHAREPVPAAPPEPEAPSHYAAEVTKDQVEPSPSADEAAAAPSHYAAQVTKDQVEPSPSADEAAAAPSSYAAQVTKDQVGPSSADDGAGAIPAAPLPAHVPGARPGLSGRQPGRLVGARLGYYSTLGQAAREDSNRGRPKDYTNLAKMGKRHATEEQGADEQVNNLLLAHTLGFDMRRAKLLKAGEKPEDIAGKPERVKEGLIKAWGWSAEDVAHYYDPVTGRASGTKVKYLRSPQELASFAVKLGATLVYGRPPVALDTTSMFSKASGAGWGIFVMDAAGNVFVGQHRVGLFHHSSFKAGGDVAAAGEMQAESGKLKAVTAKSGHYMPDRANTRQLLDRLAAKGCPLAGVTCKVWIDEEYQENGQTKTRTRTAVYDADDLLKNGEAAKVIRKEARF